MKKNFLTLIIEEKNASESNSPLRCTIRGQIVLSRKNSLITIIVPVYNEEETLEPALTKLINVVKEKMILKLGWSVEVLVINDGSTDRSADILKRYKVVEFNFQIIDHMRNLGKGSAISTALKIAKGEICIIQDADLEYNPNEIPQLLKPLVEGKLHVVYGSRFLNLTNYNGLWSNLLGNKALSFAGSLLIRRRITDIMTCYKAFRRDLLKDVKAHSFDVEPEITAKLLLDRNIKFIEIPISYNPRLKGKKINKLHGFTSLCRLIITIISIQNETLFK